MLSTPLPIVEINPAAAPVAVVIWLHGLGADGHDFEPIVPQLRLPADLPVRFVFPHAPEMPVTAFGGQRARAWFDFDPGGIKPILASYVPLKARTGTRGRFRYWLPKDPPPSFNFNLHYFCGGKRPDRIFGSSLPRSKRLIMLICPL